MDSDRAYVLKRFTEVFQLVVGFDGSLAASDTSRTLENLGLRETEYLDMEIRVRSELSIRPPADYQWGKKTISEVVDFIQEERLKLWLEFHRRGLTAPIFLWTTLDKNLLYP